MSVIAQPLKEHWRKIPLRNIWLLLFYASDLFRHAEAQRGAIEESPEDLPDLVAELLCRILEKRLRRNLSLAYLEREARLRRVRGRIDLLSTEARKLLLRGEVACRFEELHHDSPRNRLVRAALLQLRRCVTKPLLRSRCRGLDRQLALLGVSQRSPSRAELSADRIGRHDSDDRILVEAARLALHLQLPVEEWGARNLVAIPRDDEWMRRLFERAVFGFYDVVLSPAGWTVRHGRRINWPLDDCSPGMSDLLPGMQLDIELYHGVAGRRIIIDTKFTHVLGNRRYELERLKSPHLYQLYTYLRSQESHEESSTMQTEGWLLYPSIEKYVDEEATIQGHRMRVCTVNLEAESRHIRSQLISLLQESESSLLATNS